MVKLRETILLPQKLFASHNPDIATIASVPRSINTMPGRYRTLNVLFSVILSTRSAESVFLSGLVPWYASVLLPVVLL
jgi:hypothetical protein